MKQFLLGLLATGMVVSTQAMMSESPDLERHLLDSTEMQDVLLDEAPATPAHVPGSMSADVSPVAAQADTAQAAEPTVVVDIHALLEDSSLTELFAKVPALKKILEVHTKNIEVNSENLIKVLGIVDELRAADQEHSLPKKQRAIATATELGLLTPAMMIYSFYLNNAGYENAAIIQHYTAQTWMRNFRDFNPIARIVIALVAVGVGQGVDYHIFAPIFNHTIGLAPATIFFALGTILHAVAQINPIGKTKDTVCSTARRLKNWIDIKRGKKMASPATSI